MKQVVQDIRARAVSVEEVPPPRCQPGGVLVATAASLVSSGTERAMIALGARSLIGRARERPDLVKKFYRSCRTAGVREALCVARARLEAAVPLGYSAAGTVLEVGVGVVDFTRGQRVACAGSGYAAHAEINWVPQNLCAHVPAGLDFEEAATGAVGCVALHAVRVADVKLGERVAVIGLGLVGQLVCQMLRAAGCVVWGIDPDPDRVRLAREMGADFASERARCSGNPWQEAIARERGMDAVIIAAATRSSEPLETAGQIARDRGVVVITGDVRVDIPRAAYYRKELEIRYSRSYGPGRYDPAYEQRGADYPYGFVRWTERRNLEAYLDLLAAGKVRAKPLITHRFEIGSALRAYEMLSGARKEPQLGILLTYPGAIFPGERIFLPARARQVSCARPGAVRIGWIGAGAFARGRLLPALRGVKGIEFAGLANATGISARRSARDFGFRYCTADAGEVIADPGIDAVFITTRHNLHAPLVRLALERGKHVFVEKPLCLTEAELGALAEAYAKSRAILCVGFNRRFSPFARECGRFFEDRREPLTIIYRVNAGRISADHWALDPEQGGGRIVGEVCHFVDFAAFLASSRPESIDARRLPGRRDDRQGDFQAHVNFADGSRAAIFYLSSGSERMPKERVEVFAGDKTAVCEDFARRRFYSGARCESHWALRQDKGHGEEMRAFVEAVRSGGISPIPFESLYAATLATFRVQESLSRGNPVPVFGSADAAIVAERVAFE
ncbi:MAG: bi-domain-containing oxidoreductase [Terriglobia bacterium]